MTQQCGICGAFLPRPKPGDTSRVCGKCGVEYEVERPTPPKPASAQDQ